MTAPLVAIRDLRVAFGAVQAVDGVDLELGARPGGGAASANPARARA